MQAIQNYTINTEINKYGNYNIFTSNVFKTSSPLQASSPTKAVQYFLIPHNASMMTIFV